MTIINKSNTSPEGYLVKKSHGFLATAHQHLSWLLAFDFSNAHFIFSREQKVNANDC